MEPNIGRIGNKTDWAEIARIFFANWTPYPTKAYCESVGWIVNPDGTVDTSGGFHMPTSDLCEVEELEELYKL